jgi:uncharacterized protein GlcG (DUF336 family)
MKQSLLLSLGMAASLSMSAAAQSLPSHKILPLELALKAASAALASCEAQGYRESVVVVDADGVQQVVLRGADAGAHSLDSAFRKAFTAASFRRPTSSFKDMLSDPEFLGLRALDKVILAGGGVPIKAGDELLGAIGAAGAPGFDKDDFCSRAGIAAIQDQLK